MQLRTALKGEGEGDRGKEAKLQYVVHKGKKKSNEYKQWKEKRIKKEKNEQVAKSRQRQTRQ